MRMSSVNEKKDGLPQMKSGMGGVHSLSISEQAALELHVDVTKYSESFAAIQKTW